MPKTQKHTLVIRPWPPYKPGRLYTGQIKAAKIDKKTKTLRVTVMNLGPAMLERLHSTEIPLPAHPGNRASRFLCACGQPGDEVGREVDVNSLVGLTLGMRFLPVDDGYEIEFETIAPKTKGQTQLAEADSPKPGKENMAVSPEQTRDSSAISFPYRKDTP